MTNYTRSDERITKSLSSTNFCRIDAIGDVWAVTAVIPNELMLLQVELGIRACGHQEDYDHIIENAVFAEAPLSFVDFLVAVV